MNSRARALATSRRTRFDDLAIAGLENGPSIGEFSLLFGVGEVEGDGVDAERGQRVGETDHEGAVLTGAGAVREDERCSAGPRGHGRPRRGAP